jgi:hypothetical protein
MKDLEQAASYYKLILGAVRGVVKDKGRNQFTISEVLRRLQGDYPEFTETTIRKHITSGCSPNTLENAATFENIGRGVYRLVSPF